MACTAGCSSSTGSYSGRGNVRMRTSMSSKRRELPLPRALVPRCNGVAIMHFCNFPDFLGWPVQRPQLRLRWEHQSPAVQGPIHRRLCEQLFSQLYDELSALAGGFDDSEVELLEHLVTEAVAE